MPHLTTLRAGYRAVSTPDAKRAPEPILWQIFAMEAGASEFEAHPGRGRFNAAFFHVMDGYIDWHLRKHKEAVYADLPRTVVEIGSGVGANFRYVKPGTKVIAVEPNHTCTSHSASPPNGIRSSWRYEMSWESTSISQIRVRMR